MVNRQARVDIDRDGGEIKSSPNTALLKEVEDPEQEISLEKTHESSNPIPSDDVMEKEETPKDFGRVSVH